MVSSVISEQHQQRWNHTEVASVDMLQSEQKSSSIMINQSKAAEEIQRQIQEHFKAAAAVSTAVQAVKSGGPLKSAFSIRYEDLSIPKHATLLRI